MNIEDTSSVLSAADFSTSSLSTTETSKSAVVEITTPSEVATFHIGEAYCDTRPEVLERALESIRRYRKKEDPTKRLPTQVHVRILHVCPDGIWAILDKDPSARPELIPLNAALALIRSHEWLRTEVDPLPANRMCDQHFTSRAKLKRDRHFSLIRPLVE